MKYIGERPTGEDKVGKFLLSIADVLSMFIANGLVETRTLYISQDLCHTFYTEIGNQHNKWLLRWELLWPKAFKIPAHLGMTSYTINAAIKPTLTLLVLTYDC